MPARVIDRITVAYQAGRLTPEETADIFASFYTPDRIREFGQRWAGYGWLSHRMPILNEALSNHIDGRHYSAVCLLLPQIEGGYCGRPWGRSRPGEQRRHHPRL